jgi:histidinol phosphatase-like enzyme
MLFLFDIDGTLVRSFLREGGKVADFDLVEVLPRRAEVIAELYKDNRTCIALVTNQGGVALGYQTKYQVAQKITRLLGDVGISRGPIRTRPGAAIDEHGMALPSHVPASMPAAYVSFGLEHATEPEYTVLPDDTWRKPGPGMLIVAMLDWQHLRRETVFVGDMDSDRAAAIAADVSYVDAEEFFGA